MTQPSPHLTHTVTNQPEPRIGIDEFSANRPLRDAVTAFDAAGAASRLESVGRLVGSSSFASDAVSAAIHEPVLRTHDRSGHRLDEVDYDPGYHRVIAAAIAAGAHTSAWSHPHRGASVARAAAFYLFAQAEPGHACPISMTHAAVPVLRRAPELAAQWLPRAFSREYEPSLAPAGGKASALFGMAMTEKQGGSDVRAGRTLARPAGEDYLLTGHKWFCSAPMSDAFLVLAQAEGGLGCFFVPRVLPDGTRNVFRIQRLKDKLGNRSNASAEVEFDGTVGRLVGEPGRGVATIIDMVAGTRLDCVIGTAAGMRQCVAEAIWHAQRRRAFGRALIDQPAMRGVLADLALESEAATWTAMRLAAAEDADATDHERRFARLATAVAKYWVCKRGPGHAYEAMECLGGNGYIEDFPLARRYREQPVMAIWEGAGNVIALDAVRSLSSPGVLEAFQDEVSLARGADRALDAFLDRVFDGANRLRSLPPEDAHAGAREFVQLLALALQAGLLVRFAPAAIADAFVASRLADRPATLYGALPRACDVASLLARA